MTKVAALVCFMFAGGLLAGSLVTAKAASSANAKGAIISSSNGRLL